MRQPSLDSLFQQARPVPVRDYSGLRISERALTFRLAYPPYTVPGWIEHLRKELLTLGKLPVWRRRTWLNRAQVTRLLTFEIEHHEEVMAIMAMWPVFNAAMTGELRPLDAATEIKLQDIAEQFAKQAPELWAVQQAFARFNRGQTQ
jgi:hypothetical protein